MLNEQQVKKWRDMNGPVYLDPMSYIHISEDSLVMDLGFYKGVFARKFTCKVLAYEGCPSIYENNKNSILSHPNIILKDYGLGSCNTTVKISSNKDASSVFNVNEKNSEDMRIVDVFEEFENENIQMVDLLKINIEGGEYELLDRMIESGIISRVSHMMIQFHKNYERGITRDSIRERLTKTHSCYVNVDYVWEGWELTE